MVLNLSSIRRRIEASVHVSSRGSLRQISFRAMASPCRVVFYEPRAERATEFTQALIQWMVQFESTYTRFDPDSLIGQINANDGGDWIRIDPETETIFRLCDELHFLSNQALDPSSLPFTHLWNWKAKNPRIPRKDELATARDLVGWNKVERRPGAVRLPLTGMGIDLGGVGKEYAVDRTLQLAADFGIMSVLIDYGRDIRALDPPPGKPAWHIGLEDPNNLDHCHHSLGIRKMAVATSGNCRRHFTLDGRQYGHIIDPRDGLPVNNSVLSATVVSPSCVLSGALATAIVILGVDAGLDMVDRNFQAEAMIHTEHQYYETKAFNQYRVH